MKKCILHVRSTPFVSSPLLSSPLPSPTLLSSSLSLSFRPFVCSDQLAGFDMAAEAVRRPCVEQRTGSWLACQQWCGHAALWRQRYELQHSHPTWQSTHWAARAGLGSGRQHKVPSKRIRAVISFLFCFWQQIPATNKCDLCHQSLI